MYGRFGKAAKSFAVGRAKKACGKGKWKEKGYPNFLKCANTEASKKRGHKERTPVLSCPRLPKSADAILALAAKVEKCNTLRGGADGLLAKAEGAERVDRGYEEYMKSGGEGFSRYGRRKNRRRRA